MAGFNQVYNSSIKSFSTNATFFNQSPYNNNIDNNIDNNNIIDLSLSTEQSKLDNKINFYNLININNN